jgi:hypothetical protein
MQWEHRVVMATSADFEAILNELGTEGWEIAYVTVLPGTSPIEFVAIMKRPRPAGQPLPTQNSSFL